MQEKKGRKAKKKRGDIIARGSIVSFFSLEHVGGGGHTNHDCIGTHVAQTYLPIFLES